MDDHDELLRRHREQWSGKRHHSLTFGNLNTLIEQQAAQLEAQCGCQYNKQEKIWSVRCEFHALQAIELEAERRAHEQTSRQGNATADGLYAELAKVFDLIKRSAEALNASLKLWEADARLWPTADKVLKPLIAELRALAPETAAHVPTDAEAIEAEQLSEAAAPGAETETPSQFIYKLNAMEHASQADHPDKMGYAAKREAVLSYVAALERDLTRLRTELEPDANRYQALLPIILGFSWLGEGRGGHAYDETEAYEADVRGFVNMLLDFLPPHRDQPFHSVVQERNKLKRHVDRLRTGTQAIAKRIRNEGMQGVANKLEELGNEADK